MHSYLRAAFFVLSFVGSVAQAETSLYLEAGIPAPSREWTGGDYERTLQVLSVGKVALPRFSDRHGEAILTRLTSTENFSFHRNRTLPLQARLEDFSKLYQNASSLGKLYFAAATKDARLGKEVAHLVAFLLHTSEVGVELLDEFLPTIPRDDKYAVRMDGLKRYQSGLTIIFVGAEITLAERNNFSADDRSVVLEAMAQTLPRIKIAFLPDYRVELARKLEADKARFTRLEDIRLIDMMVRELGVGRVLLPSLP